MKAFVVLFSVAFVLLNSVDSAQASSRGEKKHSNMAVMLAYRPNSEIQTKHSNKTWTYKIEEDSESMEDINAELLEALIKERFAKRVNPMEAVDQRKTVKRENVDEDFESHESHEDVDEAKIVAIGDETSGDKKTCYKKTYQNVLNAFESALKSQIDNYKKCVCKKTTTTTQATTTTTEATTTEAMIAKSLDSDEELIDEALANKDDIVCFHRKYDIMLNKILERIPCQPPVQPADPTLQEFNGDTVKRAERNNNIKRNQISESESESVEIDASDLTPKPKTTTSKPLKSRKSNENDKLNDQILTILKEHLKLKKSEKVPMKKQTSPKKITIRPRAISQIDNEQEDEPEELDETSHQDFMKQLQELFEKYQVEPDGTFPMRSKDNSVESEPSVSQRKPSKKSKTRGTVEENSDESTEAVVNLKTRKAEKKHNKLGEDSRKASKKHNSPVDHSSTKKKSYRSSARVDDASDVSVEESLISRSHNNAKKSHRANTSTSTEKSTSSGNNNAKKTSKVGKNARSSSDDRLASDLAKKISDFARGKPAKSKQ